MPSRNIYHLTWVSLTLDVGYLFMAAPAKHSHCSLPWTRGYLLTAAPPDLECGVASLGPPAPAQPALSNSMKLCAMPCWITQDGQVIVERSDKTWSIGEGNGKPLQYSCLENPMNSMKRQKDRTLKEEFPRSVSAQYATGDQWRNNSRKNEGMEPKQKQHPVVDVTGDRSKV